MERILTAVFYHGFWIIIVLASAPQSHSFNLLHENKIINGVARKIDEYRISDMGGHDEQMRLWSMFNDFVKEPTDSRLFIIAYGDLPGKARRHSNRAKNYLVTAHGVHPARIVTVDGGFQAVTVVEFWIVPTGAQEPIIRPSNTPGQSVNDAWKYDEFPLQGWWFGEYGSCCERQPERLDGFAGVLDTNPGATGYLIVHNGTFYCETCLKLGQELRFAQWERDYLTRTHKIAASRIKIVRGAKVGGGLVELWIVPSGARLPRGKQRVTVR